MFLSYIVCKEQPQIFNHKIVFYQKPYVMNDH